MSPAVPGRDARLADVAGQDRDARLADPAVPGRDARLADLAARSVEIIGAGQAPSGAYLASPSFPVYRYSWLRDGAFVADAMSRAGEIDSAEAFFAWCARVLAARASRVEALVARRAAGAPVPPDAFLPARYTVDGDESGEAWADFQLDGYGAWLWALDAHRRRHRRPLDACLPGAIVSARYVAAFWDLPCYDWWEERPDEHHTSTLAALHGGLAALAGWPEVDNATRALSAAAAGAIRDTVLRDAERRGRLAKWLGGGDVDGSLLAAAVPFGLLAPGDPLMRATVGAIEADLVHAGGVHRYPSDTYYGGGEWLLLAGFLGWTYAALGRDADARGELEWIARHATEAGELPEQVDDHLLEPAARPAWLARWGPVATPLLWSHAMYLTLACELGVVAPGASRAGPRRKRPRARSGVTPRRPERPASDAYFPD